MTPYQDRLAWLLLMGIACELRIPCTTMTISQSMRQTSSLVRTISILVSSPPSYVAKLIAFSGIVDQVSNLSWWPKDMTWRKSGLYVGHWTLFCEAWYQKQLTDIQSGQACPLSSRAWKDKLRFDRHSNRVVNRVEQRSWDYLS